jgi:excisionase family DNA binding protein
MTNSTALNATKRTNRPIDGRRATLTVTEAADILGISRSTAYELARSGTLPALRLGNVNLSWPRCAHVFWLRLVGGLRRLVLSR